MKNHHKIAFRGEADERPGEIPGDVVLVVEQQASTENFRICVFSMATVLAESSQTMGVP